jgi:hypothetical protein
MEMENSAVLLQNVYTRIYADNFNNVKQAYSSHFYKTMAIPSKLVAALTLSVAILTGIQSNVTAQNVLQQTVSPTASVTLVIKKFDLREPLGNGASARMRGDASGTILEIVNGSPNATTVDVRLTIPPTPLVLGEWWIEIISGQSGTAIGERLVHFQWPDPSSLQIKIWRSGTAEPLTSDAKLVVAAPSRTVYTFKLTSSEPVFLSTDRLASRSPAIKIEDDRPKGVVPGISSSSLIFEISVDGSNLPNSGLYQFELRNSDRHTTVVLNFELTSTVKPVLSMSEPARLNGGSTRIVLFGQHFDAEPTVDISGTAPAHTWTWERENSTTLRGSGQVDANAKTIVFAVKNSSGEKSNPLSVDVDQFVGSVSIPKLRDGSFELFPEREYTLTLELSQSPTLPVPEVGKESEYKAFIGQTEARIIHIGKGGVIDISHIEPKPTNIPGRLTEITRTVRILHNGALRWQSGDQISFQLRPHVTKEVAIYTEPLFPGGETTVKILGEHFRPAELSIELGRGLSEKPGATTIKASEIQLTIIASDNVEVDQRIPIAIVQGESREEAGNMQVQRRPSFDLVNLPTTIDSDGDLAITFDGTRLQRVGAQIYVARAVKVGKIEEVLRDANEFKINVGSSQSYDILNAAAKGLSPGDRVRVEVWNKNQPDVKDMTTLRVERSGASYFGLRIGLAALRLDLSDSASRNAAITDAFVEIELLPLSYSNALGIGFGATVLGATTASSGQSKLGIAVGPVVRFEGLSVMLGRQLTTYPLMPGPAKITTDSTGTTKTEPMPPISGKKSWYIMIGLSLGTDVASLAKSLGLIEE